MAKLGLVLTGGGAHAAYQAGALAAIAEIWGRAESPFEVIAGVSAGAINGAVVGASAQDFPATVRHVWDLWANLTPDRVFRTDARALAGIGARWALDLGLGGLRGGGRSTYLLDTTPLRSLLSDRIDFDRLHAHVVAGRVHGVGVTATHYHTGAAVTYFDGAPAIEPWSRGPHVAARARLTVDHIMASSAIPIFFPPVRLANGYHGDGCIRSIAPLSPAVHMGADRILAIGIRRFRTPHGLVHPHARRNDRVSSADIVGVLLNAVFLDSLDTDLERMERINRTLSVMTGPERASLEDGLRPIGVLALEPTRDLATLASKGVGHFPGILGHLLRGLGATDEKGRSLLSYLAFEPDFTRTLLDLGHRDAMQRRKEIEAFLAGG